MQIWLAISPGVFPISVGMVYIYCQLYFNILRTRWPSKVSYHLHSTHLNNTGLRTWCYHAKRATFNGEKSAIQCLSRYSPFKVLGLGIFKYVIVKGDVKIQLPQPSVCRSQSPPAATEWLQHSYVNCLIIIDN